jgi:membrane-bound serine protease (ClpP class)
MVYLVRRGVKAAMEDHASLLVLDMDTNGGRLGSTEEIIKVLNQFKGQMVTYVDTKAFSAGAFIAFGTKKIYMAPQSVIGAAAPIMLSPFSGPAELPPTVEAKMNSAVRALVRTSAEKNGYDVDVVEAMIDKSKELKKDGEVLNEKGQILTLTNTQAEKKYGTPPKPLLSSGTFDSLDGLLATLGYGNARRVDVKPTGVETLGSWLNTLSPLLLLVGVIGIYIEFKTPGFGLPGIVGITAFVLYFLGGYVAGLSGVEWIAVFILGLILLALELFAFPGTALLGFAGVVLMLAAIIMAMVDIYPTSPDLPVSLQFQFPLHTIVMNLAVMVGGSFVAIWLLSQFLPKTSFYSALVSHGVSGDRALRVQEKEQKQRIGEIGVAQSNLRPGGKAQFGDDLLDVITQGDMIPKGARVRITGYSGADAIVESAS